MPVDWKLRTPLASAVAVVASTVVGWPVAEGRLLLMDLIEHATRRDFVYRHSWRAGDLVIWDNLATMHRGRPFDDAAERRELRRGAESIGLEPQVFDLLAYLVQERHRVVGKDDLVRAVWGGRSVSDSALTTRIHGARRHLRHLIRADVARPEAHKVEFDGAQVTVVDLHNLNDRAKRFVVGVVLRRGSARQGTPGLSRPPHARAPPPPGARPARGGGGPGGRSGWGTPARPGGKARGGPRR